MIEKVFTIKNVNGKLENVNYSSLSEIKVENVEEFNLVISLRGFYILNKYIYIIDNQEVINHLKNNLNKYELIFGN